MKKEVGVVARLAAGSATLDLRERDWMEDGIVSEYVSSGREHAIRHEARKLTTQPARFC